MNIDTNSSKHLMPSLALRLFLALSRPELASFFPAGSSKELIPTNSHVLEGGRKGRKSFQRGGE